MMTVENAVSLQVRIVSRKRCCRGTGKVQCRCEGGTVRCRACDGCGSVWRNSVGGAERHPCAPCRGTGRRLCAPCGGAAEVPCVTCRGDALAVAPDAVRRAVLRLWAACWAGYPRIEPRRVVLHGAFDELDARELEAVGFTRADDERADAPVVSAWVWER
jgi:hypothetical protein